MIDIAETIKGLESLRETIRTATTNTFVSGGLCAMSMRRIDHAIELIKEQQKEIKAFCLLIEWAEECGFGIDCFEEEYDRYKDEIKDMKYIDGMVHVARRTLEDHGVFET